MTKPSNCINCIAILTVVCCLAGCAAAIHGGERIVNITSNPTGANVTIDNKVAGTTPVVVALKRQHKHFITIEKQGYEPYKAIFIKKLSVWYFGNLVFTGPAGFFADATSGSMFNLVPRADTVATRAVALIADSGRITATFADLSPFATAELYDQNHYVVVSNGVGSLLYKKVSGSLDISFPYKAKDVLTGNTTRQIFTGTRNNLFSADVTLLDLLNLQVVDKRDFYEAGLGVDCAPGASFSIYSKFGYGLALPVYFLSRDRKHPMLFKPSVSLAYIFGTFESFGNINNQNKNIYLLGQTSGSQFTIASSRNSPGGTFNTNTLDVGFRHDGLLLVPKLSFTNPCVHQFYWSVDAGWVLPVADWAKLYLEQQANDDGNHKYLLALLPFNHNGDVTTFNNKPFLKSPTTGGLYLGVNIGLHIWSDKSVKSKLIAHY